MAAAKRPATNHLATAALLVSVLLVSVVLATTTDLPSLVRTGIAVVVGVMAAGVTTAVASKRR